MIAYRPDIDGLRAVAVLAVVLYHADSAWLPGGFVGVDLFFVISGYLITKIIAQDIRAARFSLVNFYLRRAKRILPALFVVLAATSLLSILLLTPSELRDVGRLVLATTLFASNFVLWQEAGYFDIASESKPLLHTWSLAVEEQFYLLWPLALLLLFAKRLPVRPLLLVLIAGSFALSAYGVVRHPPATFFLLPTRAWELLMGAALALGAVPSLTTARARDIAGYVGIGMIGLALVALNRESLFPGWNALLPCVGAVLVIHAGESDGAFVRRLLSLRPIVFVGLISYSLYLWHWPLLSLARISQRGELTQVAAVALLVGAFILSVLTWRYVENPFRRAKPAAPRYRALGRYAVASGIAGAVGAILVYTHGFAALARPEITQTEIARWDANPRTGQCLKYPSYAPTLPGDECRTSPPQGRKFVVVWGDSHADAVAPGIVAYAARQGLGTYQLTMAICPPLIGIDLVGTGGNYDGCAPFNESVLRFVTRHPDVEAVVLAARWAVYTELSRFGREDPGPVVQLAQTHDRATVSREAFAHGLDTTINALRAAGTKVIVLGQVPEIGINVPNCLARNYLPLSTTSQCTIDAERVRERLSFSNAKIEQLENRPGVCTFFPHKLLCPEKSCTSMADGVILYKDDDHLSAAGAELLSRRFDFTPCIAPSSQRPSPQKPITASARTSTLHSNH